MTLQYAVCNTCRMKHLAKPGSEEATEFFARHRGHAVELIEPDSMLAKLHRVLGVDLFQEIKRLAGDHSRAFAVDRLGYAGYKDNSNVKEAFGTATVFTKTNANLATSSTAGWQSNAIDNSTNLYDDMLVNLLLAAVNTAPANGKAVFMYAFGLVDPAGTAYTSTGAATPGGSEGTLTYPDISSLPVVAPALGVVPYPVQNVALNGGPFAMARCFGGILTPKNAVGMVNYSGMTLSVTNIGYVEVYYTVA